MPYIHSTIATMLIFVFQTSAPQLSIHYQDVCYHYTFGKDQLATLITTISERPTPPLCITYFDLVIADYPTDTIPPLQVIFDIIASDLSADVDLLLFDSAVSEFDSLYIHYFPPTDSRYTD